MAIRIRMGMTAENTLLQENLDASMRAYDGHVCSKKILEIQLMFMKPGWVEEQLFLKILLNTEEMAIHSWMSPSNQTNRWI